MALTTTPDLHRSPQVVDRHRGQRLLLLWLLWSELLRLSLLLRVSPRHIAGRRTLRLGLLLPTELAGVPGG
jgi:hypothetical protein